MRGTAWKPADDEQLRTLAGAGESCLMISQLLKRTPSAVRKRAELIKIKLAHSRRGLKAEKK